MPSYNKVLLMGHLTKDPEMLYTPGGTAVATFTVACNRKWKGNDNEIKEDVEFIDCKAFSGTAETIANHLSKGNPIFVEGRYSTERWEDKNTGEKKSRVRIVVEKFQFIGQSPKGEGKTQDNESIPY